VRAFRQPGHLRRDRRRGTDFRLFNARIDFYLSLVSIRGKNDKKEAAIAAPNEWTVEARRREDEIGFGRPAKIAGRIFLIRDSIFEIQSRIE
jgi:hypothetical protein